MRIMRIKAYAYYIGIIFISYSSLAQTSYKAPVRIGDQCPDIELDVINYPKNKYSISDFKGKNLLIDFWATWCKPCIASFPKLESLKKRYSKDLEILLVTFENKEKANSILSQINNFSLPSVINDSKLQTAFPYRELPHYIWIDKNGIVRAITYAQYVTEENIKDFIAGIEIKLPTKSDYVKEKKIDYAKPIFTQLSLEDESDLVQYSMLTKYNPHLISGIGGGGPVPGRPAGRGMNKILLTNMPVLGIFKTAYSTQLSGLIFTDDSRIVLESRDSLKYNYGKGWSQEKMAEWNKRNTYCYDLMVPLSDTSQFFDIMQKDIERYFPLTANIQKRNRRCLVLKSINSINNYPTKGGSPIRKVTPFSIDYKNVPIKTLVFDLQTFFQGSNLPIIDETNYSGNIDIHFEAKMNNLELLRNELNKFGLDLVEQDKSIDVLVIKDKL